MIKGATAGRGSTLQQLAPPFLRGLGALALAITLAGNVGCDQILALLEPGPEVVEPANALLRSGDLPGAAAELARLNGEHPNHAAIGTAFAYVQLLQGDTKGADTTLANLEAKAGDKIGEVKLRRALVALQAKDLDAVKTHGKASNLPAGLLLAAEVHLVDLEREDGAALLRQVASSGGAVGDTAKSYLDMLDSGDQMQAGLAEATALWALGERRNAAEAAEELLREMSADASGRDELLLLWAGRSVTSGLSSAASSLLDEIAAPPEGQAWRVQATRALVEVAEGRADEGARILQALEEGGAPADGLADAMATACALADDKEAAKMLAARVESAAAARCLLKAGARSAAANQAPPGALKSFLEAP